MTQQGSYVGGEAGNETKLDSLLPTIHQQKNQKKKKEKNNTKFKL